MGLRTWFWTWTNQKREEKIALELEELRQQLVENLDKKYFRIHNTLKEVEPLPQGLNPDRLSIEQLEALHIQLSERLKQKVGAPDEE